MAKTIYDKPVRVLIRDMLQQFGLQPGQVITTRSVLSWFSEKYPKIQPSGLKAFLVMFSTNDASRLHHPVKPEDDLLFKIATGQFRLYEPGKDPAPIHDFEPGGAARQEEQNAVDEDEDSPAPVGSTEFVLERDLQHYLAKNLDRIELGLKLYEGEAGSGLEFAAGGRFIDILAVDKNGGLVVLELKVSKGYDRVVGQLLRYVNWIRQNMAETGQKVRGMIVCRTISEDLRLACAGIKDVELLEYQLSVTVTKVPPLDLTGSGT